MLTESEVRAIKPVRYLRKVTDGGGLYLLVTPTGGRYWRFAYRFAQKGKTLALGTYPEVPLERARSRHEFARSLLANGLDPSVLKRELGKHAFVAAMREWEVSQAHRPKHPNTHDVDLSSTEDSDLRLPATVTSRRPGLRL